VAWVLEQLLGHGPEKFNLQTNTPVTKLERAKESWVLHTPRGKVIAKHVLLTTNAYTSHLLPSMKNLIYPVRGQVSAVEVPKDSIPLPHTHVWFVDETDSDVYLIQRDVSETIILGGLRSSVPGGQECMSHDNVTNSKISDLLHGACSSALKLRPRALPEKKELPASMDWTGIMGFSGDGYPWVGAVPEALGGGEGLWVAAGYSGHGMPVAARAAIAAAQQILHQEKGIQLPPEFVMSEKRAKKLI
jgi:glycine/D-amino acid oxidase-like deaminating enzyme